LRFANADILNGNSGITVYSYLHSEPHHSNADTRLYPYPLNQLGAYGQKLSFGLNRNVRIFSQNLA
jgi:hypothetical protein